MGPETGSYHPSRPGPLHFSATIGRKASGVGLRKCRTKRIDERAVIRSRGRASHHGTP
jgi:hypothetical protein